MSNYRPLTEDREQPQGAGDSPDGAGSRRLEELLALLEAIASLMGFDDADEVFAGVAEGAARHIGFPRVAVFSVDYNAGTIDPVVLAERGADGVSLTRPEGEPIPLRPGRRLAEFALGDRPLEQRTDRAASELQHRLLVQMRTGGSEALVGVIRADSAREAASWQIRLLRSLARLGAAAVDSARSDRLRSQLISSVSHELRTPLAGIRAYNELLLDGDAGEINDEQRMFLERIEKTCMQLDRMIDDMIDLSRMRAGEVQIPREPVDVVAVIEHIIDTLSPEAARREVALRAQIDGSLPLLSSNADRLAQVLFNLVGNAVKYVGEGGNVLVRAGIRELPEEDEAPGLDERLEDWGAGSCLLIEVIDDGPGIAPEEQPLVFDEFYRARRSEGSTEGSGLGLAIARRLTRLLGGILELTSTPGEGSTFYLAFPLAPEDEPQ